MRLGLSGRITRLQDIMVRSSVTDFGSLLRRLLQRICACAGLNFLAPEHITRSIPSLRTTLGPASARSAFFDVPSFPRRRCRMFTPAMNADSYDLC